MDKQESVCQVPHIPVNPVLIAAISDKSVEFSKQPKLNLIKPLSNRIPFDVQVFCNRMC